MNEKLTRIVLLSCCVLVTIAILFHVSTSYVQRDDMVRAMRSTGIERQLSDISSKLQDVGRANSLGLSGISSGLSDMERTLRRR